MLIPQSRLAVRYPLHSQLKNPMDEASNPSPATHDGKDYSVIKEGLAEILIPPKVKSQHQDGHSDVPQAVFYNPIQQFNRDLSVLAIKILGEDLAVIRKARHKRRLESLVKKGRKHKKRALEHEGDGVDRPIHKKSRESQEPSDGTSSRLKKTIETQFREGKEIDGKGSGSGDQSRTGQGSDEASAEKVLHSAEGSDASRNFSPLAPLDQSLDDTNRGKQTSDTCFFAGSSKPHVASLLAADDTEDAATNVSACSKAREGTNLRADMGDASETAADFSRVPTGPRESIQTAKLEERLPFIPTLRILDALSATGLRAIRYAKEIPLATSITANDLSVSAVSSIKANVKHNELLSKVHPIACNAITHMYSIGSEANSLLPDGARAKYDVIDLDPYGTAAPFLDAAVQALSDGGLLCCTCTDAGVFASAGYPEKTFSQYGGLPFKGPQSHEAGLRLIINAVAVSAARYGIAVEPLLSLSIDFYARVFVRVRRSPQEVKLLAGKTMLVYNCDVGCGAWTTQLVARTRTKENKHGEAMHHFSLGQAPTAASTCEHCGSKTHLSGPMWGGPLHNPFFVQRLLDELPSLDKRVYATVPRLEGMLSLALNETLLDPDSATVRKVGPADPHTNSKVSTNNGQVDTLLAGVEQLGRLDPASPDHHPFFVMPSVLSKALNCIAPSDAAFRGALVGLGYRTSRSHTKPGSIRTDAPWTVIWEVMREWVRQKDPAKEGAVKAGTPAWGIWRRGRERQEVNELKKKIVEMMDRADEVGSAKRDIEALLAKSGGEAPAPTDVDASKDASKDKTGALKIVFDEKLGKDPDKKKMVRYQINPRANWGPMNRARGGGDEIQ